MIVLLRRRTRKRNFRRKWCKCLSRKKLIK